MFVRLKKTQTGSSYSAGLMFSLASFGTVGIITLFTSVLSSRLYGITIIGQFALVLAPLTIVTLLSTVREQPAMVRELAKLRPRHPRVTGIFLAVSSFSFVLTFLTTILGIIVCYFAFNGALHNPELFAPAAVGLLGYLVIINTCWNIDGLFGAFRASRELFAVRLNQAAMNGIFIVAFNSIAHNVWGLLIAYLGSWLTALVHRLLLIHRIMLFRVPMIDIRAGFSTLREIVSFGLKLTPGFFATGLSEVSGTLILGATSSISSVGAYSRAWNFATRLTELNWRITEMLLPTLVQHRHTGDDDRFSRVLTDSLRYTAFGMLLPAAVGGGSAEAIMHIFGAGFDTAAAALRWLLLVPLLQTLTAIQGTALMADNRPLWTTVAQIARFVVTIVGGILLTLTLGMTGMAIAMVAGALVNFVIYLAILHSRLGASTPTLHHFRQMVGLGVAYSSGFAVSYLLVHGIHGVLGLVLALFAGSVVYIALGIGVSGTTRQDRIRLRAAISRLARGRVPPTEVSRAT